MFEFDRPLQPPVTDRAAFADATDLLSHHGADAGFEAAARAERSRDAGNVLGFCRWRQAERVILLLAGRESIGSLH